VAWVPGRSMNSTALADLGGDATLQAAGFVAAFVATFCPAVVFYAFAGSGKASLGLAQQDWPVYSMLLSSGSVPAFAALTWWRRGPAGFSSCPWRVRFIGGASLFAVLFGLTSSADAGITNLVGQFSVLLTPFVRTKLLGAAARPSRNQWIAWSIVASACVVLASEKISAMPAMTGQQHVKNYVAMIMFLVFQVVRTLTNELTGVTCEVEGFVFAQSAIAFAAMLVICVVSGVGVAGAFANVWECVANNTSLVARIGCFMIVLGCSFLNFGVAYSASILPTAVPVALSSGASGGVMLGSLINSQSISGLSKFSHFAIWCGGGLSYAASR